MCVTAGAQTPSSVFDGTWSVQVITDRGDCGRVYRYPVITEHGRARYAGPEALNISGQVAASGAVRGIIAQGPHRAYVTGGSAVSLAKGPGRWREVAPAWAAGTRKSESEWVF